MIYWVFLISISLNNWFWERIASLRTNYLYVQDNRPYRIIGLQEIADLFLS